MTIRSTRKSHAGTALSSRQLIILAQRVDFYMLGEGTATLVQGRFNHRYGVGGKLEEIEIRPMTALEVRAASVSKSSSGES